MGGRGGGGGGVTSYQETWFFFCLLPSSPASVRAAKVAELLLRPPPPPTLVPLHLVPSTHSVRAKGQKTVLGVAPRQSRSPAHCSLLLAHRAAGAQSTGVIVKYQHCSGMLFHTGTIAVFHHRTGVVYWLVYRMQQPIYCHGIQTEGYPAPPPPPPKWQSTADAVFISRNPLNHNDILNDQ